MGKTIPSYTKILTIGSMKTETIFDGEVVVQEKVDGSQFRFGIDPLGEIVVGTKSTVIGHPDENTMFKVGVEYVLSIADKIKSYPCGTYFYGEYLSKPKHNVLGYERTPLNHIVLFDANVVGRFMGREELESTAKFLGVDVVPQLFVGTIKNERVETPDGIKMSGILQLQELMKEKLSFLGREIIEGCVIKNYGQTILLGGNVFPLFCKYVRSEFKERHGSVEKMYKAKAGIDDYVATFKTEARWQKAIIRAKEQGVLLKEPKDIGALILSIQEDIKTEESENIKNDLYNRYIGDILRKSIQGFPDWYKDQLANNQIQ